MSGRGKRAAEAPCLGNEQKDLKSRTGRRIASGVVPRGKEATSKNTTKHTPPGIGLDTGRPPVVSGEFVRRYEFTDTHRGSTRGQSRVSLPLVNATHLARRRRSSTPLELKPTRKMGKKTPVASRRSAAVTDAGMRQHPPLGKPARVSDSRRESSVSESEAFSSRAGLCGGNAAVRTHWKTTVTNETGYRRGGLEKNKRPGHPLFPCNPASGRGRVCTSIVGKCGLIWLILPVVICLSQRLSHACLSTYSCTVKPRMAH